MIIDHNTAIVKCDSGVVGRDVWQRLFCMQAVQRVYGSLRPLQPTTIQPTIFFFMHHQIVNSGLQFMF